MILPKGAASVSEKDHFSRAEKHPLLNGSGCFCLVSKHGIQFSHDDNLILIIDMGILAVCDLRVCMSHDILALLNIELCPSGD